MEPFGLDPTHGPDPHLPEEQFESGGFWYCVMVLPLRLPHFPVVYWAVGGSPILLAFYEEIGGWIAEQLDGRSKVLVFRKKPPYWNLDGWQLVHVEVCDTSAWGTARRIEMLRDWKPESYEGLGRLNRREARRAVSLGSTGRSLP